MHTPRPVDQVTTEDLRMTVRCDRNDIETFEARCAFTARTGADWRVYAPIKPRTVVTGIDGCGPIYWHNFVASGVI
jgi:hypothetical protein